jgi:hypothetical protein
VKINNPFMLITLFLLLLLNVELKADSLPEILATGTPYDQYNKVGYDVLLIEYLSTSNSKIFVLASKVTRVDNSYLPNLNGAYKCSDFMLDQVMNDYYDNWDSKYINGDRRFLNYNYFRKGLVIFSTKSTSVINRYICVPHNLVKKFIKNDNTLSNKKNKLFTFFEKHGIQRKIYVEKKSLLNIRAFPVERLDLDSDENPS